MAKKPAKKSARKVGPKPSADSQKKIKAHKSFVKKTIKELSDTFLVNRLMGRGMSITPTQPPFTFVLTIENIPGMEINEVMINGTKSTADSFKQVDGKTECTLKALVSTFHFRLNIDAIGTPGTQADFTMTCDTKTVFTTPQKIKILNGRGGYTNSKVPLP